MINAFDPVVHKDPRQELPIVETVNRRQNYTKQEDELEYKEMFDCMYAVYNLQNEPIVIFVVELFCKRRIEWKIGEAYRKFEEEDVIKHTDPSDVTREAE